MAEIYEYKAVITGFDGGPGVNTIYSTVGQEFPDQNHPQPFMDLWITAQNALSDYLAPGVVWQPEVQVKRLEVETGNLLGLFSCGTTEVIADNDADGNISRATQAKLQFLTDHFRNNRVLRGGYFFGPLGENSLDNDGRITASFRMAVQDAFNGMLDIAGGMRLVVWHRPTNGGSDGAFGHVQEVSVGQYPATLRGRNGR